MRSPNVPAMTAPPSTCSVTGCEEPVKVKKRGLCTRHYARWQRHGTPVDEALVRPLTDSAESRFRRYIVHDVSGCWVWTGGRNSRRKPESQQYGVYRRRLAHRWSYEHFVGLIPPNTEIDHLCRRTLCVNPAHLEPVSHQVNIVRGESPAANHARKTHCAKGHPYDRLTSGKRVCRECSRKRSREWYRRTGRVSGVGSGGTQRAKTVCAHGHPYDEHNTYWRSDGTRDCRTCRRLRKRKK